MAQRQNTFAALLAALTLAPQFVHSAQQTDQTNEEKHANVSNALLAAAQVGGALAAAQNPAYALLIDAAVKAAVASAKQNDFAPPPPIAMVPMAVAVAAEQLPADHPLVTQAAKPTGGGAA